MKKFITATMALLITTFCGLQLCVHKESLVINEKTAQTDIIKAINLYGKINHDIKKDTDKVHTCDIAKINKIDIQYDYKKKIASFNYSVDFYQTNDQHSNYLTQKKPNRQPEVNGTFSIDLHSQVITKNKVNINFLTGINPTNYLPETWNILMGSKINFDLDYDLDLYLILNGTDWDIFLSYVENNIGNDGANNCLKILKIFNSHLRLTNDEWFNITNKIFNKTGNIGIDKDYAACIHVIKHKNQDFEIAYNNFAMTERCNIPLPDQIPHLPLFAFQDNEANNYQQHYWFNQSILSYLNDIYHDKTKFHDDNWNLKGIECFLISNQLVTTNLKIEQIASTIIKLFEKYETKDNQAITHLIQQLYYSNKNYSGVLLSFDKNQNLILNHAALGAFIKNNKPAVN